MQELIYLFITFIFYSFVGWFIETCLSVFTNKKFINRGFLIGPYCPIYGIGCLCLIFILKNYTRDPFALFIIGTAVCSFIEYFTSFLLEKIFKARWWDYSNIPYNVNGRICLSYSFLFGFGGLFILNFNPVFQNVIESIPTIIFNIISAIICIIFIIDIIVSFNIINKLKLVTIDLKTDNTEEITIIISNVLREKSRQFKRLLQAFPNIKISVKKRLNK